MSDYLPYTFTTSDNTEFQTEFITLINRKDTYALLLLTQAKLNPSQGAGPNLRLTLVEILPRIKTALQAIDTTGRLTAAQMTKISALIDELGLTTQITTVDKIHYINNIIRYLKTKLALLPNYTSTISDEQKVTAQRDLDLATAHLNFVTATIALKTAIKTSFGEDNYQILKWIDVILTGTPTWENANKITLNLRKPDVNTRFADTIDDSSAILRSFINPHHIATTGYFQLGTTDAYGTFIPVDPSPLGKGDVDVAFNQLAESLNENTLYHFRAVGVHKWLGQFLGEDAIFTTSHASAQTVTFDGNGNDGGTLAAQSSDVPIALFTNGFTLTGYTFVNWNTSADGSGTTFTDGQVYDFSADLTLYAQWTITLTHYEVISDGNGNYEFLDENSTPQSGFSNNYGDILYIVNSLIAPIANFGCHVITL